MNLKSSPIPFSPRRLIPIGGILAILALSHIDFSQAVHACGSALETSPRYDLDDLHESSNLRDPERSPFKNTGSIPGKIDQESIEIEYFPRPSNDTQGCGLSKEAAACVSTAALQIRFDPPHDEDTPPHRLGYRVEMVGDLPPFVQEGSNDSQYYAPEGVINLEFLGDADLARQLSIVLRPLDPEGNLGDPSEPVSIDLP